MDYKPIPVTERTLKIKEEYMRMPVAMEDDPYVDKKYRHFCTGDRWITLGFLEGWLANEDAPTTRRRRALAEAAELYAAQPVITENELLAGHLYLPAYTSEEQARYDELCEMFRMSNVTLIEQGPRIDHIGLDFEKLLRVGVEGLINEILDKKANLNLSDRNVYPDFEEIKKLDFYECCLIELYALLDLQKRYASAARKMAENAGDKRKNELMQMADILDRVPAKPAQNFREAIQSVQFFLSNLFGLYPLCRPDRYLISFYEKDIAAGTITRAEAQELIDNFCLHISTRVFSRAACGFLVGGRDKDGNVVENELTYMFLTALDHIRMPDPNGALAVTSDTKDDILEYAAQILSRGVTHPAFFNDDAIVASLEKYGCTREDAVQYIHCTCAEVGIVGKSRVHSTCFVIDLPGLLLEAGKAADSDFEALKHRYLQVIKERFRKDTLTYVMRMLEASRNAFEPMRVCCLVDDCIAAGKSIWEGGERYSFLQPILVGFSTAVDSLLAIQKLVFEEKRLTLADFNHIVESDFEGQEALRQYILHKSPHYGNDDPIADEMAAWMSNAILEMMRNGEMLAGNMMMPGTFSYINHATMGARMGATYDGRHAGYSYSDGCCPVQGRDVCGPTAMLLSVTSWDQSAYMSGMVINVKLATNHLRDDKTDDFIDLLRTFMQRGGIEMQVNVVDRRTLTDARENPEAHRNLIVRIGGFSDYFIRLTDELQQEIIDRTTY